MKKLFVVFLTSFILGSFCTWFAALYIPHILGKTTLKNSIISQKDLDMSSFWDIYSIIEEQYFSSGKIEKQDLVQGAITGMVEALGDKHSEFMTPEINKKFEETLSGDFEGIGAVVEKNPLGVSIERILKGSPAKKYDIRAKDIIIQADETSLEGLDVYDAVDVIKGPAGTQVILSILRPGEEALLKISVVREKIHIPSVEEKYFEEDNIGYIAINMFGETTATEFIEILKNVKNAQVDGLIIDLRDNGGGYLQSAVQILSEFIPKGKILVKTHYKDEFLDENYISQNQGEVYDKKIVILINSNSASASEITAGALSEYNKAILVGEKTYGKGSVQQPFEMLDGSLLKLTVAKWFTPKGINIDDEGIQPHISIKFTEEDYKNTYDRQLEEAKKILRIFIEKESIALSIETYEKSNISQPVLPFKK